jgi:conjugal transfer/entry exclusion protein
MTKPTATHVLLTIIACALVANIVLVLQTPAKAGIADDMSDVTSQLKELARETSAIADKLGSIDRSLSHVADADLFDLHTASGSASTGLPVVLVNK